VLLMARDGHREVWLSGQTPVQEIVSLCCTRGKLRKLEEERRNKNGHQRDVFQHPGIKGTKIISVPSSVLEKRRTLRAMATSREHCWAKKLQSTEDQDLSVCHLARRLTQKGLPVSCFKNQFKSDFERHQRPLDRCEERSNTGLSAGEHCIVKTLTKNKYCQYTPFWWDLDQKSP
jgi:hypothetical protein